MIKTTLKNILVFLCLINFQTTIISGQADLAKRQAYLDEMLLLHSRHPAQTTRLSYNDSTWYDWLKRTGELPPDFDALPSIPFLPDPLIIDEGGKNIPVKTIEQWKEKRQWISDQVKSLISGTFPPPPTNLTSRVLEERMENGVRIQVIELRFGPGEKAKLTLELITPPGDGPFPVFMTQWYHRGWAQVAVKRGYIACIYAAADGDDDTYNFQEIYPDYDWPNLMTRAWGAHRAVDYLYTLPNVDKSKIALTGHSRNGKQTMLAAAFDERITAAISSSGGTGGEASYRFTDERYNNESIDLLYSVRPYWANPRIRFYGGREHKLPIDQNSLMALIAPRALLLCSSVREHGGGNPWGVEQTFKSVQKVYEFLGAKEKLGIRLRDGQHAVYARDIEAYMDFLDIQFKRKNIPWENKLFYDYSFEKWKSLSDENVYVSDFRVITEKENILTGKSGKNIRTVNEWEQKKAEIRKSIYWTLGDEPSGIRAKKTQSINSTDDYTGLFISRPVIKSGRTGVIGGYNGFGDYLWGYLYTPSGKEGEIRIDPNIKIPVVILLHEYCYPSGVNYRQAPVINDILSKGIAVFALDMIGFGSRVEEGTNFYIRYPHWSKLGKMITDIRASVDVLENLEFIDKEKIFLAGYALGGTLSIYAAALDERIAGSAAVSAFTPLRNAGANKDNEGVMAYSHLHGLIPRLGFFVGNENRLPVDFPEIISCIAPRPLLVIAPELDRHANKEMVSQCMKEVTEVYSFLKSPQNVSFKTPHEFNRFENSQRQELVKWLVDMTNK